MYYDSFINSINLTKFVHPVGNVDLFGGSHQVPLIGQYGLYSHAPKNSWVFTMCDTSDNTYYGIADDIENRPESLGEGDVVLYNTLTKDYIHIKQDKSINVVTSGVLNVIAATQVNITSPVANLTASGSVTVTSPSISLAGTCALGAGAGAPIARVGDTVEVHVGSGSSSGTWSGTIVSGGSNTST